MGLARYVASKVESVYQTPYKLGKLPSLNRTWFAYCPFFTGIPKRAALGTKANTNPPKTMAGCVK